MREPEPGVGSGTGFSFSAELGSGLAFVPGLTHLGILVFRGRKGTLFKSDINGGFRVPRKEKVKNLRVVQLGSVLLFEERKSLN